MNIGQAFRHAQAVLEQAGLNPAPREGVFLVAHITGHEPSSLVLHEATPLAPEQLSLFETLLARRAADEPLAYVLGYADFYGYRFEVTPAVLIPRPDTEILVQAVMDWAAGRKGLLGCEVGVGSGAVIGSLAVALPSSRWWGSDISTEALQVAQHNIHTLGAAARVTLLKADGLPPVGELLDVVVSNPPYITDEEYAELENSVKTHEPRLALTGAAPNPDGLLFYVQLANDAQNVLKPGGLLALEIGAAQGPAVQDILVQHGWQNVRILPDMAGRDRVVTAHRSAV